MGKKRHADTTTSDDACRLLCLCSIPAKPEAFSRSSRRAYVPAGRWLQILDKPQGGRLIVVVQKGRLLRQNAGRVCEGSRGPAACAHEAERLMRHWDLAGIGLGLGFCSGTIGVAVVKKGKIYQECWQYVVKSLLRIETVEGGRERLERAAAALHELLLGAPSIACWYELKEK